MSDPSEKRVSFAARDDNVRGGKYHVIGANGFTLCGRVGAPSRMRAMHVPASDRCRRGACRLSWPDFRDPSDARIFK